MTRMHVRKTSNPEKPGDGERSHAVLTTEEMTHSARFAAEVTAPLKALMTERLIGTRRTKHVPRQTTTGYED